MKVSRSLLADYFEKPLPNIHELADALTFHAFEIESVEGDVLDIKVLPNRAADCLSFRGIAKELSAILNLPLKNDPLKEGEQIYNCQNSETLGIHIDSPELCKRYIGALLLDVNVRSSPSWLKFALESLGHRSINNVVDAANYVMLNIGQPLHAFDADKLLQKEGRYDLQIRRAFTNESITILTGEEIILNENVLVISDKNSGQALGIAGIKGGTAAEITSDTTKIIIESANYDGANIRTSSQFFKLPTEASHRFQNRLPLPLSNIGMKEALKLITKVAGGTVVGIVDKCAYVYGNGRSVEISLSRANQILGSKFTVNEVKSVFDRLGFKYSISGELFIVNPPFERTDINIPEDLIEEIARIIGYDNILSSQLSPSSSAPDQDLYRGIEKLKDQLAENGFSEISTQSFAKTGDIFLSNPVDITKPALRHNLDENLKESLNKAIKYTPLLLAPKERIKLFEIGNVFTKNGEKLEVAVSEPTTIELKIKKDKKYVPKRISLGKYRPFSLYPFVIRDVSLWITQEVDESLPASIIQESTGSLLVRIDLFDRFVKNGKISIAFRLVFQSMEKTLTDKEVNEYMNNVHDALKAHGFEVRV